MKFSSNKRKKTSLLNFTYFGKIKQENLEILKNCVKTMWEIWGESSPIRMTLSHNKRSRTARSQTRCSPGIHRLLGAHHAARRRLRNTTVTNHCFDITEVTNHYCFDNTKVTNHCFLQHQIYQPLLFWVLSSTNQRGYGVHTVCVCCRT